MAKTLLNHNSYIQAEELKEIQFFISAVEKRLGHRLDETPPAEQQVESPYSYVRLPTDQQKDTMIEQAFLTDEKAELARVYLNKEGNYTLECWDMEAEEMPFDPYTYKDLGSARKKFQKQMGYVSYTQDLSKAKKSPSAEEIEM